MFIWLRKYAIIWKNADTSSSFSYKPQFIVKLSRTALTMECKGRSTQATFTPLFLTCCSVGSDTQMLQRGWGRIDLFKYSVINRFKAISAWRIYINSSKLWSHSLLSWAKDVRDKPEKQETKVRTGILVGLLIAKVSNTFPACLKRSLQFPG